MQKYKHWLIIILGTICWSLTMVKSGLIYEFGMGFWGANGHDGIWHIALIESLAKGSWQMPIFTGVPLQNYHLGFDIFAAGLHILTRIPVVTLYFQILPPLFALIIGLLVYRLTKSSWVLFFVYFGGNWAWVLGRGESTFWSQQAISTLINPPLAMSLIFLLVFILMLKNNKYVLAGLILFLLPHIKIYAGLLAFGGLLVGGIRNKKYYLTLAIGLTLYILSNFQLASYNRQLVFQPGWFLETLMSPDRLDWPRFYSAMTTYRLSANWPKGILAYTAAFLIFWFGNMGTRAIKELSIIRQLKNLKVLSAETLLMWAMIIAGGIVPMFFLQTGTSWNTIQFFYYSLFFSSLLAGNTLDVFFKDKSSKFVIPVSFLIVILTLPTTYISLKDIYLPNRPPAAISESELEALAFLKNQPPGTVLTQPASVDQDAKPPRSLYEYDSTAYVSAMSAHDTYLEDEVNLNITGIDYSERKKQVAEFFSNPNSDKSREFLAKNHIKYIYNLGGAIWLYNPAFQNSQVSIYAVE